MKYIYVLALAPFVISCSGDMQSASIGAFYDSQESLDFVSSKKAPIIDCDMTSTSVSGERKLHTDGELDTFVDNFKEGTAIALDCNNTLDDKDGANIQLELDDDYQASQPNFTEISKSYIMPANFVGRKNMALKAIDSEGNSRIKEFTVVVECQDSSLAPIIDANSVNVGASSMLNYFNYSALGAVSGGSDIDGDGVVEYSYSWDFNGDGSFDAVNLNNASIWSDQASLNDIYSIYVTDLNEDYASRNIQLRVRNECQLETVVSVPVELDSYNLPRDSSDAQIMPYYYIQSDVHSLSDNTDQSDNAHVLVSQYASDSVERVRCDYKKNRLDKDAVFTIRGINRYKEGSEHEQGHVIHINEIPDNPFQTVQYFSNEQLNLDNLTYQTAQIDDAKNARNYSTSNCQIRLRVERGQPVVPCAEDKQNKADFADQTAIIITGNFDCPSLSHSSGDAVTVQNGKFFCEVAPSTQCVGGGGGGGGEPSPQF